MVDLHLRRGDRISNGAKLVHFRRRRRRRARALGHAVHVENIDVDGGEVLGDLARHWCGGGEARDSLVETEGVLDLGEELLGDEVRDCLVPSAAKLALLGGGRRLPLRPRRELRLDALVLAADLKERLAELLPHARHAEEEGGAAREERLLEGTLERVRAREPRAVRRGRPLRGAVPVAHAGDDEGADNVEHLSGDVRERQVGDDAQLLGDGSAAAVEDHGEGGEGFEDDVVVRDHHRLGVAGGT
mmetsp:Transcript_35033/g.109946  ORF Transcript_35033/g.109946 Transcript_35033/m.109946 type:complete len:245 (-) Transcript_35033:1117-1851(-)